MNFDNKAKFFILTTVALLVIIVAVVLNANQLTNVLHLPTNETEQSWQEGIVLTQDEVVLEVGDSFDAVSYVASAYDEYGNDLKDQIVVYEAINTSEAAEYEVSYCIKSESGNIAYQQDLYVRIEENN